MDTTIKTKMKPPDLIGVHRNKYAALIMYDGKFRCVMGYQPSPDGKSFSYTEEYGGDHPFEALRHYEHTFFPYYADRWFDDWLEDHGYQRYFTRRQKP